VGGRRDLQLPAGALGTHLLQPQDAEAQLPVVLFRRQAVLLRFRPEDGLHVLVRGRVSVYEQRGQLQLVAETLEPVGAGSMQLAFEQLKERLKAEGLFDAERKRPLPAFPRTVGIVSSPTGAVIRDFLNIVGRRHSGLNVLLYPVSVQGESAPDEIETALAQLNASAWSTSSLWRAAEGRSKTWLLSTASVWRAPLQHLSCR